MKIIIPLAFIICFFSCEESSSVKEKGRDTSSNNIVDTIACGNNQGLIRIHYYVQNKQVVYLPIKTKIRAVFTFGGNFKNILRKNAKFDLRPKEDSILTIKKISENEFDLIIRKRPNNENLLFYTILKVPNTLFEWSWMEGGKEKHEYDEIWDILHGQAIQPE